jgi:acyl transferase domain-containing protein
LSEGVVAVVLKPLAAARADGDRLLAVIRASGINQDGRTNGITAPSAQAQAELVRDVHRRAGVDPAEVSLIEAHGTGTKLGDPVEFRGLTEAFRSARPRAARCALGSVKSNLGHTSFAAGLAGLIKVVLALQRGRIPPSLHFERPNEHLDLAASPFFIPTEVRDWPAGAEPRLAGVSSFGYSGTNAHVLLAEAPPHSGRLPLARRRFARERCWVDAPLSPVAAVPAVSPASAAWRLTEEPVVTGRRWTTSLDPAAPWIRDHEVAGSAWLAGALQLERALAAVRPLGPGRILDFAWVRPLPVTTPGRLAVDLGAGNGEREVLVGLAAGSPSARGRLALAEDRPAALGVLPPAEQEAARFPRRWDGAAFYAAFFGSSVRHGPTLRVITSATAGDDEVVAELRVPAGVPAEVAVGLLLEGALQAAAAVTARGEAVPVGVEVVRWAAEAADGLDRARARARRRERRGDTDVVDVELLDPAGGVRVALTGFTVRCLRPVPDAAGRLRFARPAWVSRPLPAAVVRAAPTSVLVWDAAGDAAAGLAAAWPAAAVRWVDRAAGRAGGLSQVGRRGCAGCGRVHRAAGGRARAGLHAGLPAVAGTRDGGARRRAGVGRDGRGAWSRGGGPRGVARDRATRATRTALEALAGCNESDDLAGRMGRSGRCG